MHFFAENLDFCWIITRNTA